MINFNTLCAEIIRYWETDEKIAAKLEELLKKDCYCQRGNCFSHY